MTFVCRSCGETFPSYGRAERHVTEAHHAARIDQLVTRCEVCGGLMRQSDDGRWVHVDPIGVDPS